MRDQRVTALGLAAILILSGCSAMRERRWSYCAVAGGLAGAAVGAGTAGGLVNAYEKNRSDEHTGAAAGGGAVVGAAIGALLGHVICDPTEEAPRSEEHTSELQSRFDLVCRLLLEKKNTTSAWPTP